MHADASGSNMGDNAKHLSEYEIGTMPRPRPPNSLRLAGPSMLAQASQRVAGTPFTPQRTPAKIAKTTPSTF